jgi:tetratricopeptide (TPR) repeat protein
MNWRWLAVPVLCLTSIARADVITLADGSAITGRAKSTPTGWLITRDDGRAFAVPPEKVVSIEVVRTATPQAAMEGLVSLRRAVQALDDIQQIIDRYQRFIASNTDPNTLTFAKQDLQIWQERQDAGLVKIGERWVTTQQRSDLRQISQQEAISARDMLSQNRPDEADQLLQQALADDPQNATAIYLQGVRYFNQNQLTQARDAFTSANKIAPNYGPILNNLAVTSWRLGAKLSAMGFYDQAMQASPASQPILDNVAEALAALSDKDAASNLAQQATADFRTQDPVLRARRAKEGFYRWGALWVTADQLGELQAAENQFRRQLESLQAQLDNLQRQIDQIDGEIDLNTRDINAMVSTSYYLGDDGILYQYPLPFSYYQLSDYNRRLQQSQISLLSQQDALRKRINQVQQTQQQTLTPKYTGRQNLIGPEAAPLRATPSASTEPSN